jgi:hemolysin D
MTVTVEVKTESRRAIDYLLSPLIDIQSTAMRER